MSACAGQPGEDPVAAELHTARLQLDTVTEVADTARPSSSPSARTACARSACVPTSSPERCAWNPTSMAASHRSLAAVALLAACVAAAAQEREQLPIELKARSQDLDFQNGVLEFNEVTITQGQVRITRRARRRDRARLRGQQLGVQRHRPHLDAGSALASETAHVRFAGGEIASAVVTGAPATFAQQREGENSEGRANRIDYDLKRGTVEFTGDAWLKDARTEVTSETLVYSTATQRVISDEPVLITIQPGERAPEKPKPQT